MLSQSAWCGNILRCSDGAMLSGEPTTPLRTVQRIGNVTEVTYEFQDFGVESDTESPGSYFINAPLFVPVHTQGEPAYLFKIDALNVADTTSVTVDIVEAEYSDYKLNLAPAQNLQMMSEDEIIPALPIADYSGFKPTVPVQEIDRFIHRGQGVVRTYVTPVLYSKEDTVVRVYKRLKYRITAGETNDYGIMTLSDDGTSENDNTEFDINHPTVYSSGPTPLYNNVSRSYLIIAHSQYQSALEPFIEWKRTLGMQTKAVYSNNWTAEQIKTTIKQEYANDNKLYYVLFVGNHSQVPAETMLNAPLGSNVGPSDYGYTLVNGKLLENSSIPEISRGRLSVSNTTELQTVINKIISYEKDPPSTSDYYDKGVHMSYLDILNNGSDISCAVACSEDIYNFVDNSSEFTALKISRLYSRSSNIDYSGATWGSYYGNTNIPSALLNNLSLWNHGNDDFISKINDGVGYAYYIGHGSYDSYLNSIWPDQGNLTLKKVRTLVNGNKLPVIWAMSCETADFSKNNIASAFLTQSNGGCVGYYGFTNDLTVSGGLRLGQVLASGAFNNGTFQSGMAPDFRPTILAPISNVNMPLRTGEILNLMIMDCLNYSGPDVMTSQKDKNFLHYIGDPSMYMRLQKPSLLNQVNIDYTNGSINVYTGGENQNVAFYDLRTKNSYCYWGSNISFTPDNPPIPDLPVLNMRICVYGPNTIPYIVEIKNGVLTTELTEMNSIVMECENSTPQTISITIDGDLTTLNNPTVSVTNLSNYSTSTQLLDTENLSTEIEVNSLGNYAVSLMTGGNVIQTQKIQVNK